DEGNCSLSCLLLPCGGADHHLNLLSFPTRRSSDLACRALPGSIVDRSATTLPGRAANGPSAAASTCSGLGRERTTTSAPLRASSDRKSTRLNSSHVSISYAVFCWKKKRYRK